MSKETVIARGEAILTDPFTFVGNVCLENTEMVPKEYEGKTIEIIIREVENQ